MDTSVLFIPPRHKHELALEGEATGVIETRRQASLTRADQTLPLEKKAGFPSQRTK
jgi:hypothetical protein